MKTTNQIIGENLKKIRELSGFTQKQVALSIGADVLHASIMKQQQETFHIIF